MNTRMVESAFGKIVDLPPNTEWELFDKETGTRQWTRGNFIDLGDHYVVWDGVDYINFNKAEYELRKVR